jgi:hypothetical protein
MRAAHPARGISAPQESFSAARLSGQLGGQASRTARGVGRACLPRLPRD